MSDKSSFYSIKNKTESSRQMNMKKTGKHLFSCPTEVSITLRNLKIIDVIFVI